MKHARYNTGDYTLEEIATRLGITRERVRQIEQTALRKLRHPKVAKHLRDYLENAESLGGGNVVHVS